MAALSVEQGKEVWNMLGEKSMLIKDVKEALKVKSLNKGEIYEALTAYCVAQGSFDGLVERREAVKVGVAGGAGVMNAQYHDTRGILISKAKLDSIEDGFKFKKGQRFDLAVSKEGVITLKMTDKDK